MFGLFESGELQKLKIESYAFPERERRGGVLGVFTAFINPDEFTINYNVGLDSRAGAGKTSSTSTFVQAQPISLSLKFFLDGTGANGQKIDVAAEISKFYDVVGYNGTNHEPKYLRIIWGSMKTFKGKEGILDSKLTSATVQYKMFKADGTPLRAIINANFVEALTAEQQEANEPTSSPDLTHVRVVKEGDTLPGMTFAIYGNFKYYLEVAKVNGLNDFRNLVPGQKIFFPPYDKNVKIN